jgi:dATP pyrophosphohydrolase
MSAYRRPESVLVVVHTGTEALLLCRRRPFAFWQSVTGSLDQGEDHAAAAARELEEETGITGRGRLEFTGRTRTFIIDPRWRHRFAPGVTENLEYEWRYRVQETMDIRLSPTEHSTYLWLPIKDAAEKVWSWTNREALESLLS